MNAKIKILALLTPVFLTACSYQPPAPIDNPEVEARVRAPASEESEGVQVYSLQNPAVKQLMEQAHGAEQQGDFAEAGSYLERGLRIDPRDPQLLQRMAEVQLQMQDYQQALNFAVRSYDTGPRVGEICSRNWRTIGVAREHLQDSRGANEAQKRAKLCMNTKPKGL